MANNKKKIFDITPPSSSPSSPGAVPRPVRPAAQVQPAAQKTEFKKPLTEKVTARMPRVSFKINKPILIVIVLLVAVVCCFIFINAKAVIEIWPVKNPIEFTAQFSSTGEKMTKDYFLSREFNTTGKAVREDKAQGVIKVYNNYHLDQILVANTRFWCFVNEELREFKTKERVVIPAGQQLDVEVVASAAGEEYNIGPCTFSVPGLKGSPRYTAVYGESSSSMTGGKQIEVTQVTQADLDNAELILRAKALEECRAALEEAVSSEEYIMLEDSMEVEVTELIPLTEVGKVVENFVFQIKAEGEVLVLRRSELQEFAKNSVLSQIDEGQVLVEGSLGIGYLPETIDLESKEVVLEVEIDAETYAAVDENYLKDRIKNMRPDEIRATLRNFAEIEQVQTRLTPFWATTAPENPDDIEIKVIVD